MVVAVFGDAHAHAEGFDAVIDAAVACGVDALWSLGDMIGRGPDPEHVVARTRERCDVALMGNHDYGATGSAEPTRFGEPGSAAVRSIELARERVSDADVEWMRSRKPAARRGDVQCWHGGPRNAVHEYVGRSNAAACIAVQRGEPRAGRPHACRGRVAGDAARRERGEDPCRRPAGSRRRQVVAESGRRRCARPSRRGLAGGTVWTTRRLTARTGCCSIWSGVRRRGDARRTTRRRRGSERARSASTRPEPAQLWCWPAEAIRAKTSRWYLHAESRTAATAVRSSSMRRECRRGDTQAADQGRLKRKLKGSAGAGRATLKGSDSEGNQRARPSTERPLPA